jgi:hypothetical protein
LIRCSQCSCSRWTYCIDIYSTTYHILQLWVI